MKKMRKLLAVLMTLAMVMGLGMTSFAAEPATVTIEGAEGTVYKYVQLVKADRESVLGWQFVDEATETAFINAFKGSAATFTADDAIAALINIGLIEATTAENYYIELGDINPSAALGAALETLKAKATNAITGNSVDFSEFGLYMITAKHDEYTYIPMAVYINTDYDDVAAKAKGSKNEITKTVDGTDNNSVDEGDVVAYTAKTVYPFYSADAQNPKFTVTDKLTNATYNRDSVKVYIDVNGDGAITEADQLLGADPNYTVKFSAAAEGETFTEKMVIDFNYNANYASEKIIIKYDVTVGAGAAAVGNKISSNFDTSEDYVELDKVEVEITKVDNATSVALEGATFEIYKVVAEGTEGAQKVENPMINDVATVETLYLKTISTKVSDENGKVVFDGLDAQDTYYIKETIAPVGYSLNNSYYLLENDGETGDTTDKVFQFANFDAETVKDTKLNALPSTGGIGTTIFTVGGCVIMIAAAYMFFVSRRKEEQ